jgi:hypothetical protein
VARSPNHCFSVKTTMRSLCIVELHVTLNNIKTMNVAQECVYGEYVASNNKTRVDFQV